MSCKCFNRRFVFKNTDSFDHKYVNSKCKCTSRFTICENKSKFTIASKDISEVDKIKIVVILIVHQSIESVITYLYTHHPLVVFIFL